MESTSSSSASNSNSNSNSNSLELKIMSCKDLRAFNFFQKLTVYAQVSIVDDTSRKSSDNKTAVTADHHQQRQRQKRRTPTDKEGNRNPEWNHSITLDLNPVIASFNGGGGGGGGGDDDDDSSSFLHFVLRHEGAALFGDKTIGEVSVPLKRLIEESRGVVRCLSYQVRTTAGSPHRGKPNGVLTFSCKFNHSNDDVDCTINNPTTTNPNPNPNPNPNQIQNQNQNQNPPQHQLVLTQNQNQTTEAVLVQDYSTPKQLHEFPSPDGNIRYPSIQEEEEEIKIGYPILELQNDILSKEVKVKDQEETMMMSDDHQYRGHQDRSYGGSYSYYYPPPPPPLPPPPPPPVYYPHPAGVPPVTAGVAYSYGGCYCDCPNKHQRHEYCSGGRQGNGGWWRPTSLGRY